jgi:hypothetical protein
VTTWIMTDEVRTNGQTVRQWVEELGQKLVRYGKVAEVNGMQDDEFKRWLSIEMNVELMLTGDRPTGGRLGANDHSDGRR